MIQLESRGMEKITMDIILLIVVEIGSFRGKTAFPLFVCSKMEKVVIAINVLEIDFFKQKPYFLYLIR